MGLPKHVSYISILEGSEAVASCVLQNTAKLEADKHHVAYQGGVKAGWAKIDEMSPFIMKNILPWDHWAIHTISTTNALCWAT